ncbi:MAG: hypothetical protein J0I19_13960 [Alphaproteobacteria bacterium]|nr:hypothetical protein [Alphaproteobacteria bacterium]
MNLGDGLDMNQIYLQSNIKNCLPIWYPAPAASLLLCHSMRRKILCEFRKLTVSQKKRRGIA